MTDLKASRLKGERVEVDSEEFFFVKASILNSQTVLLASNGMEQTPLTQVTE